MIAGGYVLAGGAASRMGAEKSALMLGEQSLLQIAIAKLQVLCADVAVLCGTHPERAAGLARSVCDAPGAQGPLAGIIAALEESSYDWNLFLAVDAPLLPVTVLQRWMEMPHKEGASILLSERGPEPFPLLLHRQALFHLKSSAVEGNYRMLAALQRVNLSQTPVTGMVGKISVAEEMLRPYWFTNANTRQEMELLKKLTSQ